MTLRLMKLCSIAARLGAYAWAGPNTAIGLLAGVLVVSAGGRAQIVEGVVEFSLAEGAKLKRRQVDFDAVTLGHVVLGRSALALSDLRSHEHAHVRQYERWGPFFLPAYVASSAWHWLRGGHVHADNHFERRARAESG